MDNRVITIKGSNTTVTRGNMAGGAQGIVTIPLQWNCVTTPLLQLVNLTEYLQALADVRRPSQCSGWR